MGIITKKELLPFGLILLIFVIGIFLYPYLPDKVPTHWNIQGEVDGWSSRNFAVFFLPGFTLFIYLLMLFIPYIDPLRKNYSQFNKTYFWLRILLVSFLLAIHLYTLAVGLGWNLNINLFLVPIYAALFILIGLFLPKIKKNYFVGIRTPWTLHSEEVWNRTHQFAGRAFIIAGLVILLGIIFPQHIFWLLFFPILSASFGSVIYSYFVFRRLKEFGDE